MNDNQPDLWSIPVLPYQGTSGHVAQSDTSTDRAVREDESGTTTARQSAVLSQLADLESGATWRALGSTLNLHHGQISGALSMLHKAGHVFMLKEKRHGCHPYVHARWRDLYGPDERIDVPAQTASATRRRQLGELLHALDTFLNAQPERRTEDLCLLERAYDRYRGLVD